MQAQDLIRRKRDGLRLDSAQIDSFVAGLVDGSWSDAQAAAFAMAAFVRGLDAGETVDLTRAMTRSGTVLDWSHDGLPGPVLDKHSTGGVGDKVSLLLAPIVAACGGIVPMLSGRGLGHTGGTLDKLDSIPGYRSEVPVAQLRTALREAGCAIVGQTAELAPADRRLYALRDQTGTVESLPLITASILSKKLAAGVSGLVMDVKVGNGAFAADLPTGQALARSLVDVAQGAGLPVRAWITDMNQVLGHSCGHAVEVDEALQVLKGGEADPRLLAVTRQLSAELLRAGRLATTEDEALQAVDRAIAGGQALERFARMVASLGGPRDFVERSRQHLPSAPVLRAARATRPGIVQHIHTAELGRLLIGLGGGRRHAGDRIDPRVGLTQVLPLGRSVMPGDPLACVRAADAASADAACKRLHELIVVGDGPASPAPVLIQRL
jgi:thymidine phosphorylase